MTLLHQAAQKAVEAHYKELGDAWIAFDGSPGTAKRVNFALGMLGFAIDALVAQMPALQHQEVPREPVATLRVTLEYDDEDGPLEIVCHGTELNMRRLDARLKFLHRLEKQSNDCAASPSTTQQQEAGNGSDESAADSIVAELVAGLQRAEVKRKQRLSDLPAGTCETCMGEGYLGSIESQRITDCTDCIGGVRQVAAPSTPESAEKDDAGGGKGPDHA